MMKDMDGWSVLSSLKSDPATASIPVVMMTIVDHKNLGYAMGASEYLVKPVGRSDLLRVLRKYQCGDPPCRVLLVEDDSETREIMSRALAGSGWDVIEATNGIDALQKTGDKRPALVLLDLMMPEMDGFQFLEEFRSREDRRDVPVIVVTAKDLSLDDRHRLKGNVEQILEKGLYSKESLLEEISRQVAVHMKQRQAR
jgi:CheY-like chemotaxis protein